MANGINTFGNFTDERSRFKNEQKKDRQKMLTNKFEDAVNSKEENKNNIIYMALEWGLADAGQALRGKGGTLNNEDEEGKAFKRMTEEIKKYFSGTAPEDMKKFDDLHEKLCEIWADELKNNEHLSTYGIAQKVVNMAFKYLYCCEGADDYKEHFTFCHVPLDSFTLEWCYRRCKNENEPITRESLPAWSTIDKYRVSEEVATGEGKHSYMYFQNYFRKWFGKQGENEEITPLQAEFIYWPLMREILAAEDFIKTFEGKDKLPKCRRADEKYLVEDLLVKVEPVIEKRVKKYKARGKAEQGKPKGEHE